MRVRVVRLVRETEMLGKATLKRHAGLVDSMADTVGVDLEQAMLEGRLSVDQLSDVVLTCTGCSEAEACERWLAMQKETVSETPDYCRNTETFQRLSKGESA